jgi:hypothetical protein
LPLSCSQRIEGPSLLAIGNVCEISALKITEKYSGYGV